MIREIIENLNEGKRFHPIDVFGKRWVITDGKDIFGDNGEVRSIKQFKKDMKNPRTFDQWDYIYFPTEELAKDAFEMHNSSYGPGLKLKELSYL